MKDPIKEIFLVTSFLQGEFHSVKCTRLSLTKTYRTKVRSPSTSQREMHETMCES